MLRTVERILDYWEANKMFASRPDKLNLALLLDTQQQANYRYQLPKSFQLFTIPAILEITQEQPDVLLGVLDPADCYDVYCLGPVPHGTSDMMRRKMNLRLKNMELGAVYFGGLVLKNGRMYLLSSPVKR